MSKHADEPKPDNEPPPGAQSELLNAVYEELRAIAARRMSRESSDHTLQPTALVSEAYLRLMGDRNLDWKDESRFYIAASGAMRRVLLDHARRRNSLKRGAGRRADITNTPLEELHAAEPEIVIAVDEAIEQLAAADPRAAEIVRLRYYGGLEFSAICRALELSERTVMREWAFARARLYQLVEGGALE